MSGKPSQAKQPAEKEPLEGKQAAPRVAQPTSGQGLSANSSRVAQPTSGQGLSANSSRRKPLLVLLSMCIALAAIGYVALQVKRGPINGQNSYQLSSNMLEHFRKYDTNGDGFIDPYEFASLLNSGEVSSRDPASSALVRDTTSGYTRRF